MRFAQVQVFILVPFFADFSEICAFGKIKKWQIDVLKAKFGQISSFQVGNV